MIPLILVGTGDHYRRTLLPSIATLEKSDNSRLIASVDTRPLEESSGFPHFVRAHGQPLSEILDSFKSLDPIVYLAHPHNLHTMDALDLVNAGFRVAIEKPYAITFEELNKLRAHTSQSESRIFLAEYYLMAEAAPLLNALRLVTTDSFLHHEFGLLKAGPATLLLSNADLSDLIGAVRFVYVDILEGKGEAGTFEHRGDEYADRKKGGGIIMDLGVHAFAPLVAIAKWIGEIRAPFRAVESAVAMEFRSHAISKGIAANHIAETYSTTSFETTKGIPVVMGVAKYTPSDRNQRRLILVGEEGEAMLDMSSATLYVAHGDKCPEVAWRLETNAASKYVPVLKTILDSASQKDNFAFNTNEVCYKSQDLTLAWRDQSNALWPDPPLYSTGLAPTKIRDAMTKRRSN